MGQLHRYLFLSAAGLLPLLFAILSGVCCTQWYVLLYCVLVMQPIYFFGFRFRSESGVVRGRIFLLVLAMSVVLCCYDPIFWLHFLWLNCAAILALSQQRSASDSIRNTSCAFRMISRNRLVALAFGVEVTLLLLYVLCGMKTSF